MFQKNWKREIRNNDRGRYLNIRVCRRGGDKRFLVSMCYNICVNTIAGWYKKRGEEATYNVESRILDNHHHPQHKGCSYHHAWDNKDSSPWLLGQVYKVQKSINEEDNVSLPVCCSARLIRFA